MKQFTFFTFFFVFIQTITVAATDPVADFLNGYMKKKNIPGVAVMVRKDGAVVRSEGYGLANLEHNVKVKPETIFQSGSMGKQFTAMAVMILVDEKKLALSDSIQKHLTVPDTWKNITIRHLLTHTAGLGDYAEDFSMRKDYTEDELLKMVIAQPLAFQPGEKWSYSNLGYLTLGILIRKVSGKFYGDFLEERVFEPLGMKSTSIISESDIIPNRAAGYEMRNDVLKNQEWVSPSLNTTADGAMYFNVEDLAKWDEALDARKILTKESYEEMWTPMKLKDGKNSEYGFGWSVDTGKPGHPRIEHGGAWQGFTSHIVRYPEDQLSVVVLCNLAGCDSGYIAHKVAGIHKPELAIPTRTAIQLEPAVLKSYEGEYSLQDQFSFKVQMEGKNLVGRFRGPKHVLVPESKEMFFEEDSENTYRFVKDEKGNITELIISGEYTLRKVK